MSTKPYGVTISHQIQGYDAEVWAAAVRRLPVFPNVTPLDWQAAINEARIAGDLEVASLLEKIEVEHARVEHLLGNLEDVDAIAKK